MNQINFLHQKIGGTEWSGILLYSHREGGIEDADNMVVVAEEIYPMDIGSPGYTEYINDVDSILDLVDNYERYESGELKIGHIHTHHSMGTGFSSTDMSELQGNAPSHNYYLSLIVNFKCKPTAKIATICEVEPGKIKHPGASGEVTKQTEPEKRLGVYECVVTQELDQRFLDRYSLVLKKKKEEEEKEKKSRKKTYPGVNQTVRNWDGGRMPSSGYGNYGSGHQTRLGFAEPDFSEQQIENFIYRWFNLNPNLGVAGGTEGAIDMLDMFIPQADRETINNYVEQLIDNYEEYAIDLIGNQYYLTDDEYLKLTKIVIQKLEPYEDNKVVKGVLDELEMYEDTLTEMVQEQ